MGVRLICGRGGSRGASLALEQNLRYNCARSLACVYGHMERKYSMPVQTFAPMTKDFATFDCDAHVTEPPRSGSGPMRT